MKYLGVSLTKHVQDSMAENIRTLVKEIKDMVCLIWTWIGTLHLVKIKVDKKI